MVDIDLSKQTLTSHTAQGLKIEQAPGIKALTQLNKHGRPPGMSNLHSKQPSGIAQRLKRAGVDWIDSFGMAIKNNDRELLSLWLRLLPYLVVTYGHQRVKKFKGRASKAAIQALERLESGE